MFSRMHVLGMLQENSQNRKLRRGKRHLLVVPKSYVPLDIESQQSMTQLLFLTEIGRFPADSLQNDLNACHQLSRAEGLRYIVVSTDFQPYHSIHFVSSRRQEQNRYVGASTKGPAHL